MKTCTRTEPFSFTMHIIAIAYAFSLLHHACYCMLDFVIVITGQVDMLCDNYCTNHETVHVISGVGSNCDWGAKVY